MPRNNKRKKKLSIFKKFLCIYCGILLLAGVITLIMLHSLLKDYEEGMPSGTMDKIVNQFTPDGIGKLLSLRLRKRQRLSLRLWHLKWCL
jgi:hypothetical protein